MNYVELHIGDYEKATAHLTACEDGIYGRLLRRYYDTEKPLPNDMKAIERFARARSREEKKAVATVVTEFFFLATDGFHHKRCDEEIALFREKQVEAGAKRDNEAERQRRHRERRKSLFDQLREFDIVPDFDSSTRELEAMLSRVTKRDVSQPVTRDMGEVVTRDATATQSPDTSHQSSIGSTEEPPDVATGRATAAGAFCLELKKKGCARVNPQHPDLLTALALEITVDQLLAVADEGIAKRKQNPFTWALTTALNRHSRGEPIIPEQDHADVQRRGNLSAAERVRINAEAGEQRDRDADNDHSVVRVIG